MGYYKGQSAVIVPVADADHVVQTWRMRFDRSAPFGVPAHITVVFPFVPVNRLGEAELADLAEIFLTEKSFGVELGEFKLFPGLDGGPTPLYLAPEPDKPFRRLTAAVSSRWPEAPPYEGKFADNVPHLTVTEFAEATDISAARRSIGPALPITTRIDRGSLIVFDGTYWREHQSLPLKF